VASAAAEISPSSLDALIALAEAGLHASARERLLAPLARTYQLASLAPLAQLFSRTAAMRETMSLPGAGARSGKSAALLQLRRLALRCFNCRHLARFGSQSRPSYVASNAKI
jgi:hypothetical protein